MIRLGDVYKKVEDDWVSRLILDEVVIMPLCRSEEDVQYIYSISNQTGSRIWQLLDGKHSVRDIQEVLKLEYQGQKEVIEREALEFLKDIFEAKLIKKIKEKTKNQKLKTKNQNSGKKKTYKRPEIVKVKMQPEQAVLSCCVIQTTTKQGSWCTLCAKGTCKTGGPTNCLAWVTASIRTAGTSIS